jgi:hypothetical protein
MDACQNDRDLPVNPVPNDVGKATQHRPTVPAVPFRIREWVAANACEQLIECLAKLTPETFLLSVVPVLYCDHIELCRPTKYDARFQRRRCSRRALTSGQGL